MLHFVALNYYAERTFKLLNFNLNKIAPKQSCLDFVAEFCRFLFRRSI